MMTALIYLAILVIVWIVIDWLKVPEPVNRIVKVVLVVAVVIVLVNMLLTLAGQPGFIRIGR